MYYFLHNSEQGNISREVEIRSPHLFSVSATKFCDLTGESVFGDRPFLIFTSEFNEKKDVLALLFFFRAYLESCSTHPENVRFLAKNESEHEA